jgi:cell wall-associated NlpC family hydrolase
MSRSFPGSRSRTGALALSALWAVSAGAQQLASAPVARAAPPVHSTVRPTAARPAAATPAARGATPIRFRSAPRRPVAALAARGSNPVGPFARLTELQRDSIVENSRSMLGIRYRWAGETPERGVDCSGLVRYVFAKLGIDLPHSSGMLARLGSPVESDTSRMQPGDLLVFSRQQTRRISHVGIYVGDGMMIHASSNSKAVVETPVADFRGLRLRGVRRVFALDSAAAPEWRP